jgi:hypothetical protein
MRFFSTGILIFGINIEIVYLLNFYELLLSLELVSSLSFQDSFEIFTFLA